MQPGPAADAGRGRRAGRPAARRRGRRRGARPRASPGSAPACRCCRPTSSTARPGRPPRSHGMAGAHRRARGCPRCPPGRPRRVTARDRRAAGRRRARLPRRAGARPVRPVRRPRTAAGGCCSSRRTCTPRSRRSDVPADDFGLWVCLHEATHRLQFTAVPWLRDVLRRRGRPVPVDRGRRPRPAAVERLPRGAAGTLRATSRRRPLALVELLQGPEQRAVLDRLLALTTLLEGHADHVMDAVGPGRRAVAWRRSGPRSPCAAAAAASRPAPARAARRGGEGAPVRGGRGVHRARRRRVGMDGFNPVWDLAGDAAHPRRDRRARGLARAASTTADARSVAAASRVAGGRDPDPARCAQVRRCRPATARSPRCPRRYRRSRGCSSRCSGGADSLALAAAAVAAVAPGRGARGRRRPRAAGRLGRARPPRTASCCAELGVAARVHAGRGRRRRRARGGRPRAPATPRCAPPARTRTRRCCSATPSTTRPRPCCSGLGRGSGPRSIAGMRPGTRRGCRPLLACAARRPGRVRGAGPRVWDDPHNADPRFTRVRLRHEVLPLLEDVLRAGSRRRSRAPPPSCARTATRSTPSPPAARRAWSTTAATLDAVRSTSADSPACLPAVRAPGAAGRGSPPRGVTGPHRPRTCAPSTRWWSRGAAGRCRATGRVGAGARAWQAACACGRSAGRPADA